jgi:hypothetical protein
MNSSRTALVVCNPLFVSLAERLARDFGKVYLYVPSGGSFPTLNAGMVGYGLPGVERVDDVFGPHFESVDLFFLPDLGHSALAIQLEKMGKRVWGARNGEELENYRELCKEVMEKEGLPVQPWVKLKGISALRSHLKSNANQHVKIDRWRGVTETFFSPKYEVIEPKLDEIAHTLGGFKEELQFIAEDDLPDRVEVGIDAYCIDGAYPAQTLFGIEVKDLAYVGQMVDWQAIPEPLRRWNQKLAPYFAKYGYRGFLSNEIRIGADLEPYMVDATCRAPSPPSELWQELYTNLGEIIWEGANGNLVDPIPAAKFGVEVILKSSFAEKNWLPVAVPEQFERQVKLFNCIMVDGRRYVVPQDEEMSEIGAVVGWGDTLDAALDHAREAGEAIEGYGVKFSLGNSDKAVEQMQKLNDLGLKIFDVEKSAKPA